MQDSINETKPLSPDPVRMNASKKNVVGIKIIGILIIVVAALAIMGTLTNGNIIGIIRGLLFLTDGILIVMMKRWGFYILSFAFLATLYNMSSYIHAQASLITEIITVVIVGGALVYMWIHRNLLS
jgi:hypothetical protein